MSHAAKIIRNTGLGLTAMVLCFAVLSGCGEAPKPEPEVQALMSGGVQNPPPAFTPGNVTNLPGTDGYSLNSNGDGTYTFEAAAGGGGISVVGTPAAGDVIARDAINSQYVPQKRGAGVYNVQDYGASGRGEITTTGTITGTATALTLASATTFAKGQGIIVVGAGATHSIAAPSEVILGVLGTSGATTYTYTVISLASAGGYSAPSSSVNTTAGNATLSDTNAIYVNVRNATNNCGMVFYGRGSSNRFSIASKNRATNAYRLTFQAGGYTNAVQSDIGKTVTRGTSTGILTGFDNTNRIWYVLPTIYGTDTFSATGAATIGSGTGAGTTTAVEAAHVWKDSGDASTIATSAAGVAGATQPSFGRRASTVYYPGDVIVHPMSNAGEQFVCCEVFPTASNYPQSSATATGSLTLGSTAGTKYQDGNVYWMVQKQCYPVAEPSGAMPNALRTKIAAISGTSVTTADAAGNSATAQRVFHDDSYAIVDTLAAAAADVNAAGLTYIPDGNYTTFFGDSEADPYNQWDDTYPARNILFGGAAVRGKGIFLAPGASIYLRPMGHRALHADSGDIDNIFASFNWNEPSWQGGRWIYSPSAEPIIRAQDAWNRVNFFADFATGTSDQYTQAARFENMQVWNVPRFILCAASSGYGRGHTLRNVVSKFGGAGHDAWAYGSFHEVSGCTIYGDEAFGSDILYTDDQSTDTVNDKLIFTNNWIYKSRTDGIRLRVGWNIVTGNHWTDSKTSNNIILCDSLASGVLADNTVTNGGMMRITGINWSISNNNLTNAQMLVVGGTSIAITGGTIYFDTSADSYFSGAEACLTISGGTDVVVNGMAINNAETSGPNYGVAVTGSGRTSLNGLRVYSNSGVGLNVATGMSGTLDVNGGYYRGGTGPQSHYLSQNASAKVSIEGVEFDANDAGNTIYADNGSVYAKDCRVRVACQFTSGVDGLTMLGNDLPGANASTLNVPNAIYRDNVLATAPSASTQTGTHSSNNTINGNAAVSPAALASGTTDDYSISQVASIFRLDPNASNSTITSIVAGGGGRVITIYCTDAGAATLTIDDAAGTGTAANKILTKGGADAVLSNKEYIVLMYDTTQSRWVEIGGSY